MKDRYIIDLFFMCIYEWWVVWIGGRSVWGWWWIGRVGRWRIIMNVKSVRYYVDLYLIIKVFD